MTTSPSFPERPTARRTIRERLARTSTSRLGAFGCAVVALGACGPVSQCDPGPGPAPAPVTSPATTDPLSTAPATAPATPAPTTTAPPTTAPPTTVVTVPEFEVLLACFEDGEVLVLHNRGMRDLFVALQFVGAGPIGAGTSVGVMWPRTDGEPEATVDWSTHEGENPAVIDSGTVIYEPCDS